MARRPAYEIEGAAEAAKALRAAGKEGKKRVRKAGREVGDFIADEARTLAGRGDAMQRAARRAGIIGVGTQKGGAVRIRNTARVPFGLAAFLGVKGRRGWYAAPRYAGKGPEQFPRWVGNQYTPGGPGGPYFVNPAIRRNESEVVDIFTREIDQALRDLGLDVT